MKENIIAGILFLISLFALIASIRSFMGKGFLLNNAYIYASKKDREKMDKAPYYRQSAIVFLFIALIFILNGIQLLTKTEWLFYVVLTVIVATVIYAIASSILIEKNRGKKQ
ncbi:MAG: DUF3784 domain-containing protein [Clostridia bacterium]|nr:DUF3784 domain-containing protein [Clostridia bacterium]